MFSLKHSPSLMQCPKRYDDGNMDLRDTLPVDINSPILPAILQTQPVPLKLWIADMIKEVAQGPCLQVPEIQDPVYLMNNNQIVYHLSHQIDSYPARY